MQRVLEMYLLFARYNNRPSIRVNLQREGVVHFLPTSRRCLTSHDSCLKQLLGSAQAVVC
jgi:hypothetical protein